MRPRHAVLLAGILTGLAFPAVAGATSVRIFEEYNDDDRLDVYTSFTLEITGNLGEANRVVAREVEDGVFVVEDKGTRRPMIAGNDCERTRRTRVVCRPDLDLDDVLVLLRDRGDRFSARGRWSVPLRVLGDDGDDRITAEHGYLSASGGKGRDTLIGGTRGDDLAGGAGDDLVHGGRGGDRLRGDAGRDRLRGESGDDQLNGNDTRGALQDQLDGGTGRDEVSYAGRSRTVRVDLDRGRGGARGTEDRYRSIEDAEGGDGRDVLLGDDGPNRLGGTTGDDYVSGRGGDDDLAGGVVLGGPGDDTVSYGALPGSNCGDGTDVVSVPSPGALILRGCELVSVNPLLDVSFPSQPIAVSDTTLTFEIVCSLSYSCRGWKLRLMDPVRTEATTTAPLVLAEVPLPSAAARDRIRVEVPRTGELAPGLAGRRVEVVVDPGLSARPSVTAPGTYRILLDL